MKKEDVSNRGNDDVGVIGDKGGKGREDEGSGDMDVNICDVDIEKEGDDADRGIGGVI